MIFGQVSEMYMCQQATNAVYLDERLRNTIECNVVSAIPKHCAIRSTHWQPMTTTSLPLDQCDLVMFVAIYEQVKW